MEFFTKKTSIPFMKIKNKAFIFSILLFLFSVISMMMYGLSLSLDFTGGHQIELAFAESVNTEQIRKTIPYTDQQIGIQTLGGSKNVLLKLPYNEKLYNQRTLELKISSLFPDAKISHMSFIGPQIGKDLLLNGINAIVVAMICTMIYIALRFEYRFAVAATVALLHDPIITLGIFSFFQIEFDLISLAGLLTILGYSLNDTIVVYDRVKENFIEKPKEDVSKIVDNAINDTLSRTIITSGLTFLAVLSLCLFGGETLWGFSLALAIGIVVGTYSSIYIAGALSVVLGLKASSLLPPEEHDDKVIVINR